MTTVMTTWLLKPAGKVIRRSSFTVCEFAGKILTDAIIVGQSKDGTTKMMTTIEDVADIVWYLETAKHSLLSGGLEESDEQQ